MFLEQPWVYRVYLSCSEEIFFSLILTDMSFMCVNQEQREHFITKKDLRRRKLCGSPPCGTTTGRQNPIVWILDVLKQKIIP